MVYRKYGRQSDTIVIERYKEAFGLVKYIFDVHKLYKDQIRLIKVFVSVAKTYIPAGTRRCFDVDIW